MTLAVAVGLGIAAGSAPGSAPVTGGAPVQRSLEGPPPGDFTPPPPVTAAPAPTATPPATVVNAARPVAASTPATTTSSCTPSMAGRLRSSTGANVVFSVAMRCTRVVWAKMSATIRLNHLDVRTFTTSNSIANGLVLNTIIRAPCSRGLWQAEVTWTLTAPAGFTPPVQTAFGRTPAFAVSCRGASASAPPPTSTTPTVVTKTIVCTINAGSFASYPTGRTVWVDAFFGCTFPFHKGRRLHQRPRPNQGIQ